MTNRRQFLAYGAAAAAATGLSSKFSFAADALKVTPPFKISLAEWSLHRTLRDESKGLTNLDFPRVSKEEFGIDAIEYVNQFFKDKAHDEKYLTELKQRCEDQGVKSLLIMCDGEGALGDPDTDKREQAVKNHHKWVDAAKFLGCHSIRVNAQSRGSYEEQMKLASDGLRKLSEYAKPHGLNVIVENHGGLSSNGAWLAGTIAKTEMDNCGTLPDFGNFYIRRGKDPEKYDRYKGVEELMPFAKAVSAKAHDFDEKGNEVHTDFFKMMGIVLAHGYHGYVGIEYEGGKVSEYEGIKKTKELLDRVAERIAQG
ncbi:sugar phosphate isomerase/epimerase family protein [Roseiconus lacunae]|uniref:Sugar phosphate isomerase/epimerase family protein n=1 Tax=Roseiconus lacunae TaxID=2605694 RepID=A0ABT7PD81_9BACT|nr:sugar phosphate isomerase/epimerase family protein [Roseiconus lacunae]MDM4014455.1 sugar phosphate isomerase/epimerase family protein [Roseiconus lacunae]